MDFEWDEQKRRRILDERGLDFRDADLFFDGRPIVVVPSLRGLEKRWKTIGRIEGHLFTLIWTVRGASVRVISFRRAHEDEERAYRSLHP